MIVKLFSLPYHQLNHTFDDAELQAWLLVQNQSNHLIYHYEFQSQLALVGTQY